jgi:hypothetical protein
MALTTKRYNINNEPISIRNIIYYLTNLSWLGVIPKPYVNIIDNEIHIMTVYDISSKCSYYGTSLIIYNIHTQKWKAILDIATSFIGGTLTLNTYERIKNDYYYLIENNMVSINYNYPYVEYVLVSDYLEDILEPALNNFSEDYVSVCSKHINPRNIILDEGDKSVIEFMMNKRFNMNEIKIFYDKLKDHEKYLLFQTIMECINRKYYLPNELWLNIYKYY